ncbi:DNA replication/repair protein RecF [Gottfriedia sp. NPDC056225]|uniref:DNA replication/repair protein RecF n=1 Tax=Gottfriedia sp. NPDC056225 TaxID=3345751 RepID=UPI001559B9F7|nr:DNA replication/repair protein RecF [Arthrobacter citreus]
MYIKDLELRQYRNYEKLQLSFQNNVNVIIGENAQGKTNLMESIYVLALTKSHRTSNDKEMIRWDEEYGTIKGTLQKKNQQVTLQLILSKKGKKAKLNHLEQMKLSQYIGVMNVVMFAPEDLHLVKGSPQVRRKFLDMELGQVSPVYLHELSQYQRILQQRNSLLRTLQTSRDRNYLMLEVLTSQLVKHAIKIIEKRISFIKLLQDWASPIHSQISRETEKLEIIYKPSINVSDLTDLTKMEDEYIKQFEAEKEREVSRGTTLLGPHRDDLVFMVNDKNVQTFGSQGQQRTTALSLKLAEIELIKEEVGEYPILLLDDVLSELDDYRQTHLLNAIQNKVQTFVTTTSVDGIQHETIKQANIINVSHGTIISGSQ